YTGRNGGDRSYNSPEVLKRSRIDRYRNCNYFQRRYTIYARTTQNVTIKYSTSEGRCAICN
ncbi:hypothetical protein V1477_021209, partial [Vespula maculifrons]